MRLFGQDISIHFRIKLNKKDSPYKVDTALQKKVFGSHSQYLEDMFIDNIFQGKMRGTYVDIGANDPSELSNTKRFYDRGWSGVNVEPNVNMYEILCQARPRDINLNFGIGRQAGYLTFYEVSPTTLSTFNKIEALHCVKKEGAKIVSEKAVKVISLEELFSTKLPDREIDFLSVDAEGYEYEILEGNNWNRYRPVVVVVELNHDKESNVFKLLKELSYTLIYFNGTNGIFIDERHPERGFR